MIQEETISRRRKFLIFAIEAALVLIVLVLLIATYLPAIIGGNPERL